MALLSKRRIFRFLKILLQQLNRLHFSTYLSMLFIYLLSLCDVFSFSDWKVTGDV